MPWRAALLSPLGVNKGRRCAYRVEDSAGRVLKAREFESADEARRVFELRAGLEDAFAPALARHGAVLLEEWIEGEPLAERDFGTWAEPAGALLGRLHARPLGPDQPATLSTERWIAGAEADLELLGAAGKLAAREVGRLRDEIRRRDPGSSPTALVHTDFSAGNMLIDGEGRLRIIDNEGLAVRPPGLDLGRTFHLWPMPAATWQRFRRGYRSVASDPGASGFWRIVATLVGARLFLRLDPPRHEASLALLRRFLAGEQLSDAGQ
ncbi:MAG: phosphotransferase family protein [Candidatus Binatia bacterium]